MNLNERIASFLRRNSQMIPLIVIALCVGGILLLQAIQIGKFAESSKRDSEVILGLKKVITQQVESDKLRSQQIDRVDRHLDCIVLFFTQPDRADKSIEEIDSCRISDQNLSTVTIPQGNLGTQPTTEQNDASDTDKQGVSGRPSRPNGKTDKPSHPTEEPSVTGIPLIDNVIRELGL